MKNEKGITMVALVVTILIMAVLAGATFSIGDNIVKQAKLQTLNTNMLLLQAKIKSIAEEASFNKNTDNYKGQKVSEVSNDKVDKLKENGVIDNTEQCYLLSQDDLNSLGLEKVKVDDGYIVNYETEEIIYVRGFKIDDVTYYKLSETKNLTVE